MLLRSIGVFWLRVKRREKSKERPDLHRTLFLFLLLFNLLAKIIFPYRQNPFFLFLFASFSA